MNKRLAIITGASSGIGQAIAASAKQGGATVATCSRRDIANQQHLSLDLGQPESWIVFDNWITGLISDESWQEIVLIHAAATIEPIGFSGQVDVANATSAVLLNAVSPLLIGDSFLRSVAQSAPEGQSAVLMQVSSGAGKRPFPGWATYCAAKAGVDMWVRTVALEQAELGTGVRVLSIGPGVVATGMQASIRSSSAAEFPQVQQFRELHDDGKLASPESVGAKLWEIAIGSAWESGSVMDIKDF